MRLVARVLLGLLVLGTTGIVALALRPCRLHVPPGTRVDQGCINQGNDRRLAAPLVCGLQRLFSWKSAQAPNLMLVGEPGRRHLELGWPPYFVYNSPDGKGHWRVVRLGFRYDRNWRGYIFPTGACKCLDAPLRY